MEACRLHWNRLTCGRRSVKIPRILLKYVVTPRAHGGSVDNVREAGRHLAFQSVTAVVEYRIRLLHENEE